MLESNVLIPYLITNAVAILLVVLALKKHRLTRLLFVLIFLAAGLFNIYTAVTNPRAYLYYADTAVLGIYRDFINGYFSQNTQLVVAVIGLGQILVAALLSMGNKLLHVGVFGGVVFFVAIAPLGIGSAFPATLLLAAAMILMQYRIS